MSSPAITADVDAPHLPVFFLQIPLVFALVFNAVPVKRAYTLKAPLVVADALLGHGSHVAWITVLFQKTFGLINQRTCLGQGSGPRLQYRSRAQREKVFTLSFFVVVISKSSAGIYFCQCAMARREIRVPFKEFCDLTYGGGSIATHQAAGVKVVIRYIVRVLHGQDLVLLRELSQVAFDAISLYCVLVEFVYQQVIRMTLAQRK